MRRIVRAAYLGEKLGDTSALETPASLDEIKRAAAGVRARHAARSHFGECEPHVTRTALRTAKRLQVCLIPPLPATVAGRQDCLRHVRLQSAPSWSYLSGA